MRLLFRLLIVALCSVLIVTTWWSHVSVQLFSHGHDTIYTTVHPWLRQLREWSLFGVLAACLLVTRRDPTLTRIGLIAVMISLGIMLMPPRQVRQDVQRAIEKADSLKLNTNR